MKKWCLFLLFFCLLPIRSYAFESTSYTFSRDALGQELRIVQDAYQPMGIYQGLNLKTPQDMAVDNGRIYIADTGNHRVLIVEIATGEMMEIKGMFSQPLGIAADGLGRIYVADYQKNAVFRFNAEGELEMTYERPDSPAYGVNNVFKPRSVAPIGDGGIYLTADGASNGIIQMNGEGKFEGFFASNAVYIPLMYKLYDLVLTDEQMQRYNLGTPNKFNDIMMGTDGLVYAVTTGPAVRIQKLSYAGVDLFAASSQVAQLSYPIDMDMTEDGALFILHQDGYVSQLTREGVLLYRFGGTVLDVAREGLVQTAAGLGVDEEGNVYILDKTTGQIHVYAPTAAQQQTQQAINAYYGGDYDQAGQTLDQILRYNSNSYYARLYRGKAYLHVGDYQAAADQFYLAREKGEYSDAFWELRNQFLQEYGLWILLALLGVIAALIALRLLRPRRKEEYNSYAQSRQLPNQWHGLRPQYLSRAIFHPIDTAYEIRHGHMGGYGVTAVLLIAAVIAMLARTLFSGFLYSADSENFPTLLYCAGLLAVAVLFIVSNYFITSIHDGEGSLGMIASVTAYALLPIILGQPVLTLVCNALTLQEALIVHTITVFLYAVCLVNLSVMLMELHNYSFRQYLGSFILTVLFMILCILVFSLLYLLAKQCVDFLSGVWTEVAIRD